MKMTEEQKKELREIYSGFWKTRKGETDIKMVDFCMKKHKHIYINGVYIICCDLKPSIRNCLCYDDEGEAPSKSYESFHYYNMRCKFKLYELSNNYGNLVMCPCYGGTEKLMCLTYSKDPKYRLVTKTELKAINEAIEEVKADYEKRLQTYYKKYSKNIYTMGYWANR